MTLVIIAHTYSQLFRVEYAQHCIDLDLRGLDLQEFKAIVCFATRENYR